MFTAEIITKSFYQGDFKVEVKLSDGIESWSKTFLASSESDLKGQVRRELARLNELSAFSKTLASGVYDPSETTQVPPTQAELDKQEWFRDFGRLERVKKLQEVGGMPATWTADLTALQTKVQTNAKKAYIADM